MEWIRISANKLKIMLSAEDARRYELNCEHIDCADVVTRAVFREILTDVRRETGFDAAEDKVYIQMYPSKEGGCELFVTKIGLLLSEEQTGQKGVGRQRSCAPGTQKRAFVFEDLAPLLLLCRRLRSGKFSFVSEAWRDDGGAWWLFLTGEGDLPFAREYGREAKADAARLFLCEHGKAVCAKRAVETLGRL